LDYYTTTAAAITTTTTQQNVVVVVVLFSVWQDVLDSEGHHIYFKKFLEQHHTERPWSFFLDMEELDRITDTSKRQKKIASIMQTYFKKRGKKASFFCKSLSLALGKGATFACWLERFSSLSIGHSLLNVFARTYSPWTNQNQEMLHENYEKRDQQMRFL